MGIVLNKDVMLNRGRDIGVRIKTPRSRWKNIPEKHRRYVKEPDGTYNVIDITTLNEIWVENNNGVWILHATFFDGCQNVKMKYNDKPKLASYPDGTFYIKSEQEIKDENIKKEDIRLRDKVNKLFFKDNPDLLLFFISKIVSYLDKGDANDLLKLKDISKEIDKLLPPDISDKINEYKDKISQISTQILSNEQARKI